MLISCDLLNSLQAVVPPPAQLCLIRVLGSDHEYVCRVRYKEVHLDYPFSVPLFDSADQVMAYTNFDEMKKALHVMGQMVIPPNEALDRNWCPHPEPAVLCPMSSGSFNYMVP